MRGVVEEGSFTEKHVWSGKHLRPGKWGSMGLWPDLRYPLLKEYPGLNLAQQALFGPSSRFRAMLGAGVHNTGSSQEVLQKDPEGSCPVQETSLSGLARSFVFLQGKQPGDGHYC